MSTQEETQEETQEGRRRKPPELTQEQRRKGAERTNEIRRQKRLEQEGRAASRNPAFVTVPLELEGVIIGLRDKAKQGNAQAAGALLAYLTRFPVQQGSGEDWQDKTLEEMTPDELAFAEAWANRQVNRAMRRAQGMHAARARAAETASGSQDEGATRPK